MMSANPGLKCPYNGKREKERGLQNVWKFLFLTHMKCKICVHLQLCNLSALFKRCPRVSEGLLFNTKWAIVQLACWNNSLPVDMLLHLDTLYWFRANQSLLLLLRAAWLERSNKYTFYSLTRPGGELGSHWLV